MEKMKSNKLETLIFAMKALQAAVDDIKKEYEEPQTLRERLTEIRNNSKGIK